MDIGLLTFVLAPLSKDLGLTGTQPGLVLSFTFLGMFAGAALAGNLADRYGRKAVFQWTLIIYAIGTGLSAFAWDLPSLLVFRLIAGLGLGGELPVASTLVSEWSPAQLRGKILVLLESFWAYGWTIAAVIGLALVPNLPADVGWRVAFALGALPAIYALYIRRALPESPRYLLASGHSQEAKASIQRATDMAGSSDDIPTLESFASQSRASSRSRNWRSIWTGTLSGRTFMLWVLWFGMVYSYYGIFSWLPSILANKFTLVRGLEYNLVITLAQIPGYFTAAWLVERWGRKRTLSLFLFGSALGSFLFRGSSSELEVTLYGCVISFFALGAWGVIYTYTPELYPTEIRAWGSGMAAAVGRIGGIIGPYITIAITGTPPQQGGIDTAFLIFAAIFVLIAVNVLLLGEETRGQSLEEIARTATAPVASPEY
jgi:MFS transporter, putative metabolite:H+ symporter